VGIMIFIFALRGNRYVRHSTDIIKGVFRSALFPDNREEHCSEAIDHF